MGEKTLLKQSITRQPTVRKRGRPKYSWQHLVRKAISARNLNEEGKHIHIVFGDQRTLHILYTIIFNLGNFSSFIDTVLSKLA